MAREDSSPLRRVCDAWLEKIRLAKDFKREAFQKDADTCMKFFCAAKALNDHLWGRASEGGRIAIKDGSDEALPSPKFRVLVAKAAELVQLFGPSLYHRNPAIVVEPKTFDPPVDLMLQLVPPEMIQQAQMQAEAEGRPFDPAALFPPDPSYPKNKMVAGLYQHLLDVLQRINDKKLHSRRAIEEALIKGGSCLWTESWKPYDGGPTFIGSFFDSIDNYFIDPDADQREEALWIARRHCKPIWQVERDYPAAGRYLRNKKKGSYESAWSQGESTTDPDSDRKRQVGETNDLIEYWEIYSKMGMGHRLTGIKEIDEEAADYFETFGENVRIVVCRQVPFPMNLPPRTFNKGRKSEQGAEKAFDAVQWPIPYWLRGDWPVTVFAFHDVPNSPWPMSHLKPGLGYLEFITWALSFLMNRIRVSCRTLASAAAKIGDDEINKLFNGGDFDVLKVPENVVPDGDISKVVHFLDVPAAHADIWKVIEACMMQFDKATGLSELMYAAQGGMRSAKEAGIKQGAMQIRPDDMANQVEDLVSTAASKEAFAMRWLWEAEDVAPIAGQRGADMWERLVMGTDIIAFAHEFNYRVEAGSARKPNKETKVDQVNMALQQWLPVIGPYAFQTGNLQIINAFLKIWGEANEVEVKNFLLPENAPPPPDPNAEKIQAEMAMKQEEHKLKAEEQQLELQFKREEMELEKQKVQMQLQAQQAKTEADVQKAQMEMQIERERAQQEMQINQQKMMGDLQIQKQQMAMKSQEMQFNAQAKMQDIQAGAIQTQQQLAQSDQQHRQAMQQSEAQGRQKLKLGEQAAKAKMQQQAAKPAKPKPKRKAKK